MSNPRGQVGKQETHPLFKKILTAASVGLAMHYDEIQESWKSCGTNTLCKGEKLALIMTEIIGVSTPSIALSKVIKNFVNRVSEKVTNGMILFDGDSYWGPTLINVGIYSGMEYYSSFYWDWIEYATDCLKTGMCEHDDILVWICNMKIKYCNKVDLDVDVSMDCVEGECVETGEDSAMFSSLQGVSDYCVIFFNDLPLIASAFIMLVIYLFMEKHAKDEGDIAHGDDGNELGSYQDADKNNKNESTDNTNQDASESSDETNKDGSKSSDETNKDGSKSSDETNKDGSKSSGETNKDGSKSSGKTNKDGSKSSGETNKDGSKSSGKTYKDGSKSSGKTNKDNSKSFEKGAKKNSESTGKADKGNTSGKTSTDTGKGSGSSKSSSTQIIQVTCPTCKNSRSACIPNPLLVYCEKCGKKLVPTTKHGPVTRGMTKMQANGFKDKNKTKMSNAPATSFPVFRVDASNGQVTCLPIDDTFRGVKTFTDTNGESDSETDDYISDDEEFYQEYLKLAKENMDEILSNLDECNLCEVKEQRNHVHPSRNSQNDPTPTEEELDMEFEEAERE